MKKTTLAILVAASLALPAMASAAPFRQGPYIGGFVGVTIPDKTDATSYSGGSVFNDRISFQPGVNVGGVMGYDFGGVRFEGEISYKDIQFDTVTDNLGGRYNIVDGSIDTTAFMANVFFDLHNQTPITPYIGGGVGFAALHLNDTHGFDSNGAELSYLSDDDVVFAYQVGGGLEIPLNRQLSLDLAYRYFGTTEANFFDTKMELTTHNATVGLRLKF
ncbi:porin family protein [Geomonas terrae]|uniref:Porin family protein n=1 Tax=Geomonas terrae TaxID=2562681 RepID=A0A4S1CE61_9BACT|nr:outer membrane beta-barrel protein [Geomonas terrae]TGU71717.1 porin family protein [Geomonas terrae]